MMQYAILGKTGFKVSKLGLGGAPLGGSFGSVTDQQAVNVIHSAIDLGINFLDTAPSYGQGESERRFGKALNGKRHQVILATKAVMRGETYTYQNTIQSVEASLKRLQTDYIDLIQLHESENTTFDDAMNETLAAFWKLKEQGKIRAVGVNAGRMELLFPYMKSGLIDTIQTYCRYMLIDHTAKDELLPLAKEMNVGVIHGSPLGMGILADTPAPFLLANEKLKALLQEADRRKEQISFLRKSDERGLIEPAMRFSLTCPEIAVTLTGTTSLQSLNKNVQYCDGVGLSEEEMHKIFALFDKQPLF